MNIEVVIMRKQVEANEGLFDMAGLTTIKSVKGLSRKKIVQDCLYYERKILKLLRRLQAIPESVEDLELQRMFEEAELIGREVDNIEKNLNN